MGFQIMPPNRISHQRPVPRPKEKRRRTRPLLSTEHSGPPTSQRPSRRDSWQRFRQQAMQSPKAAFEDDLKVALVGVVIVFLGSIITAGGWYFSGTTRYVVIAGQQQAAPEPIIGVIVFFIGIVFIGIGVIAAILCVVLYIWGRCARRKEL